MVRLLSGLNNKRTIMIKRQMEAATRVLGYYQVWLPRCCSFEESRVKVFAISMKRQFHSMHDKDVLVLWLRLIPQATDKITLQLHL